jgi:hypothetical protein
VPIVHPTVDKEYAEPWLNDIDRRTQRKTCPSGNLSATNPLWADLGANLGLWSERPATKHLSHDAAMTRIIKFKFFSCGYSSVYDM